MPTDGAPLNILNLTEPISKLIEVVGNGIGILYEPTRIRNRAKAEADALKTMTVGKTQAQEIEARAQMRIQYLELRRQNNIEEIVKQAAVALPKTVSGQPVEEDWIVDFFGHCQDVGDETLQSLWARLLAGEVANPGSFSRRTLHTVKMMNRHDADLFTRLASFVWETPEHSAYLIGGNSQQLLEKRGFHQPEFLHLKTIGLLATDVRDYSANAVPIRIGDQIWCYCGTRLRISVTVQGSWFAVLLSQVGAELLPISGAVGCAEYFDYFFDYFNQIENSSAEIIEPTT